MNDNEIIKALECCLSNGLLLENCSDCPYHQYRSACMDDMLADALSLINRQKAEVERLQAEVDKQYEIAEANVRAEIASGGTSCHWCEDKVRAEAIKEVFEKLEERLFVHSFKTESEDYTQGQVDCMDFVDSKIEELKKEMVGDDNG